MTVNGDQNHIHIHDTNTKGALGTYVLILSLVKKLGEIENDNIMMEYDIDIRVRPKTDKRQKEEPAEHKNSITMSQILEYANDKNNKPYQEKLFTALDSKVEEGVMDWEELMTFLQIVIEFLCKIYTEEIISNLLDFDIVKGVRNKSVLYLDMNDLFDILGYKYIIIEEKECTYKLKWKENDD